MRWRRTFSIVSRVTAMVAMVIAVSIGTRDAVANEPPAASRPLSSIDVDESVEAQRQLQRLAQWQSEGRWEDAARVCERLIAEHGQTLVRVDDFRYISVTDHVHDQLAHWPKTAAAYGALFAKRAEDALGESEDVAILRNVADRWWPTSAGGAAAERLATRFLEAGASLDAGRIFERLSREHPDYREHADAAVDAAFAYARAGRDDLSKVSADRARQLGGEVIWQGQLRPVAQLLDTIQTQARPATTPSPVPDPDMLLWRVGLEAEPRSHGSKDEAFPFEPVVVGDRVYVQDAERVHSIDLNTGRIVWRYGMEAECEGTSFVSSAASHRAALVSTFSDGCVYVALGVVQPGRFSWESASGRSVLVCLDATRGTERWRVAAFSLFTGGRTEDGYFFDSSPRVQMGVAHVVVRRWRPAGYEDCYLAGIDAATGAVKHVVHLAGAPTQPSNRNPLVHCDPAAEGDSIYVQTHLGALVGVSAAAGRIRWLTVEDQIPVAQSREPDDSSLNTRHSHSLRIVRPTDSSKTQLLSIDPRDHSLSFYDAEEGRFIRRIDADKLGESDVPIRLPCSVPWLTHLPEADRETRFGRPCLTSNRIFLSTSNALHWFTRDGKAEGKFSYVHSLTGGGNVTAVDDVVLVAGRRELLCFTRRADRLAWLVKRISDRPDDPSGFLALAWLAFRDFNDPERALAAIDRVLTISETTQYEAKQRIFDLIVRVVEQVPVPGEDFKADEVSDRIALVNALLQRTERSAGDVEEQIRYRLLFAEVYERFGQPAETLRLCQSILDDRSLRSHRRVDSGESAADVARQRIAETIESNGRQAYAQYDRAAEELFRASGARDDEALLRTLLDQYPNAKVIPDVVLRIAALRRAAGAPLEAIDLLRSFWFERSGLRDERSADLLVLLAECCFEAGRQSDGLRWLARGMRAFPDVRVKVDGRMETFAALEKRPIEPIRDDRIPSLSFPLQLAYRMNEQGHLHLVQPMKGVRGATALMFNDGRLVKFDPLTGRKSDWPMLEIMAEPPKVIGFSRNMILLATSFRLLAIEERTGRLVWSFGQRPADVNAASTDPEIARRLTRHRFSEGLVVGFHDDGRAVGLRARDGRVLWQTKLKHKPTGPLALSGEYLVYAAEDRGDVQLIVLDARTGRELRTLEHDPSDAVRWLHMTPGLAVIAVGRRFVAGYDPDTSLCLWRTDAMDCTRFDLIRSGLRHTYLPIGDDQLAAIRQQDGDIAWQTSLPVEEGEVVERVWLDGPDLYVMSSRQLWGIDAHTGQRTWTSPLPPDHTIGLATLSQEAVLIVSWPRASDDNPQRDVTVSSIDRGPGHRAHRTRLAEANPLPVLHQMAVYDGALILRGGSAMIGWTPRAATSAPR